MFPWFWMWAPSLRVHWPLSGDVAQDIDPELSWFFGGIKPEAGDARIEQRAFDVASYGRQLGWITEVLIALAESDAARLGAASESLEKLKRIRLEIERIKVVEHEAEETQLLRGLERIQRRGGPRAASMRRRVRATLADAG